ncbi:ZCHC3 protein, partial [Atractosteus spatula]|nr:ZCHC3 protein [Atractosteus spatula]
MEKWGFIQARKDLLPFKNFVIEPLFARELRPLTVHMFNPFVQEAEIVIFLKRFVDIQGSGIKVIDSQNYWTGKRRFMVRLKTNESVEGGFIHPPASFSIGPNRGFLVYPGQPMVCRNCAAGGHVAAECKVVCCRRCGGLGHKAEKCSRPLTCNLCGEAGHLYRTCPQRPRSYASAARPQSVDGSLSSKEASAIPKVHWFSGQEVTEGTETSAGKDGSEDIVDQGPEPQAGVSGVRTKVSLEKSEGQQGASWGDSPMDVGESSKFSWSSPRDQPCRWKVVATKRFARKVAQKQSQGGFRGFFASMIVSTSEDDDSGAAQEKKRLCEEETAEATAGMSEQDETGRNREGVRSTQTGEGVDTGEDKDETGGVSGKQKGQEDGEKGREETAQLRGGGSSADDSESSAERQPEGMEKELDVSEHSGESQETSASVVGPTFGGSIWEKTQIVPGIGKGEFAQGLYSRPIYLVKSFVPLISQRPGFATFD